MPRGICIHFRKDIRVKDRLAITMLLLAWRLPGPVPAPAASWLGDAGHFLKHTPPIYANNPDGRAFEITVHRHVWPPNWGSGNAGDYQIRLDGPDGETVAAGSIPSGESSLTLAAPEGLPGVYTLSITCSGYSLTWVSCTLDQLVIAQGDYEPRDAQDTRWAHRTFNLHAMVPRRWYFHVPAELETMEVKHTVLSFQSHREDYGFFVMSPRGQRMAAFFGGRPLSRDNTSVFAVTQTIEVEPGTADRFWSFWACGGDSHNYSDLQILVRDVPPYYASTPEQWFDPELRSREYDA